MAKKKYLALLATVAMAVSLSACADRRTELPTNKGAVQKTAVWVKKRPAVSASVSERECLARAMYFESNRNSTDGMLAVGSVVMNRVESGRYGESICGVVGAPRQFASGVLSRPMTDRSAPVVRAVADEVLAGHRHAKVGEARYFHMAGLRFSYPNMHYVTVAGGNAFYEKRDRRDMFTSVVQVAALQPEQQESAPVSVATAGPEHAARPGAVISNLNIQNTVEADPVQLASASMPLGQPELDPSPISSVVAQAINTPLPPPRPKLLGLAPLPDKHASAGTALRVAGNDTGWSRIH